MKSFKLKSKNLSNQNNGRNLPNTELISTAENILYKPLKLDKVIILLYDLCRGPSTPVNRWKDRTPTPSHHLSVWLPYSKERALFTSIVEMGVSFMHIAYVLSFIWCKLQKLQIVRDATCRCTCCNLHVLQIARVANCTCCKLHINIAPKCKTEAEKKLNG